MPTDDSGGRSRWTVMKALQWTSDYFRRQGLETPRMDAEILLAHTLQCQRIDLYLRYDQPLQQEELTGFRHLIQRRLNREPVAYITGVREFWSLRFKVTPSVLIPRPDTECLVEIALKHVPKDTGASPMRILELGAGSGAVIVAMAHERSDCRFWASDRSWPAIDTARSNARRHAPGARIHFWTGHWLDAINPQSVFFDMILSNPPYIPGGEIEHLAPEIRLFEPVAALDGGADGLRDIGEIMSAAAGRLKPGGILLLEIGFDQRRGVQRLANACGAYAPPKFHKDYAGHDRVVLLRKK